MGIFSVLAESRSGVERLAGLRNPPSWLVDVLGGGVTKAGTTVNETTAMSITAVYSCVKIIAWTLASLPLVVFQNLPKGKARSTAHPLYNLLHDSPNPEQTSFEWRSLMSVYQNLWGAGVSEIEFDNNGNPIALWPIAPWMIVPKRIAGTNELVYEVSGDGPAKILRGYQVLVFPAISTSRDRWLSPIATHRETIGAAVAVKEFGARTFGQGTNPAGIVTHPGKVTETSEKSLKERLKGYAGLGNSHRVMLLDEGMKWERVGLPPQDAQYLETRRFDISEIARIYNVPLYMLQDHEKQTSWGAGLEEQKDGFVTFTLRPYLVQGEQEIRRKLFVGDNQHFAEYILEGLLRGKLLERYQAYAIGRQWGWLSADDICELENKNALPDGQGEIYLNPMNMINAKLAESYDPTAAKKTGGKDAEGK